VHEEMVSAKSNNPAPAMDGRGGSFDLKECNIS